MGLISRLTEQIEDDCDESDGNEWGDAAANLNHESVPKLVQVHVGRHAYPLKWKD